MKVNPLIERKEHMIPELTTSTADIIKWFQMTFPDLVKDMKNTI